MGQITQHLKIWSTLGASYFASMTLEDWNMVASIIALGCGSIASLAIAYYHIVRKAK